MNDRAYIGFEIGQVFPADSAVARFIVALCMATNDLMLAQENTGREYERPDFRQGVPLYYMYATASHFREALKRLDKDLSDSQVLVFVGELEGSVQERLRRLRAASTPWTGSWAQLRLQEVRNHTFHYPDSSAIEKTLGSKIGVNSGVDLGDGSYLQTRYDFADEIAAEAIVRIFGGDEDTVRETLERLADLWQDYMFLTHAAFTHYIGKFPRDIFSMRKAGDPISRT